MEILKDVMTILIPIIPFAITTLTFLLKFIGTKKSKKAAENLQRVSDIIVPYIIEAETFLNYSGKEKKEYVMTKATKFAVENGIKFDEEKISELVEQFVAMTKNVNADGKYKKAEEML